MHGVVANDEQACVQERSHQNGNQHQGRVQLSQIQPKAGQQTQQPSQANSPCKEGASEVGASGGVTLPTGIKDGNHHLANLSSSAGEASRSIATK